MTDRLSAADAGFLYVEDAATPMHVGGVVLLEPVGPFDYGSLVALIQSRLQLVPRYRQKVRFVPGRFARPVWVDDENFDLTHHVRRSALPQPGSDAQLADLVGVLVSRPLDRSRPLWELYVVEGLSGGRIALVNKTHLSLVDRVGSVDVAAAILDLSPVPRRMRADLWIPTPAPSDIDVVVDAVADITARPAEVLDALRLAALDVRATVDGIEQTVTGILQIVRRAIAPVRRSMLNVEVSGGRRFAGVDLDLSRLRRIRRLHGGTINDVILTLLAGALRSFLLSHGESVGPQTTLRAMVPMSVRTSEPGPVEGGGAETGGAETGGAETGGAETGGAETGGAETGGAETGGAETGGAETNGAGVGGPEDAGPESARSGRTASARGEVGPVQSYLLDLPVAESNPVIRLHQVSFAMAGHTDTGEAVGADTLMELGRFAPAALHTLGARVGAQLSSRMYNLLITNVPGPQAPLYAGGHPVQAMYPVAPLGKGHALAIAVTSYRGRVYFGITADAAALPDPTEFGMLLHEELDEFPLDVVRRRSSPAADQPSQPETQPPPRAEPQPQPEPAPEPQPKPKPQAKPEPTPQEEPQAKPKPRARPKPSPKPQPDSEPAPTVVTPRAARPSRARPAPKPAPPRRPTPAPHPDPAATVDPIGAEPVGGLPAGSGLDHDPTSTPVEKGKTTR